MPSCRILPTAPKKSLNNSAIKCICLICSLASLDSRPAAVAVWLRRARGLRVGTNATTAQLNLADTFFVCKPPPGPPVGYFEMEQASFFQTCILVKKRASSMVVGAERYFLKDDELSCRFEGSCRPDPAKLRMIQTALAAFKTLA